MQLNQAFSTSSIALFHSSVASNAIPFLGEAYFPSQRKSGIDLKWLKTHKGLGIALKPSNFDALPTVRPRGQALLTQSEMPLYRESMVIKEADLIEISRAADTNDIYVQPVIDSLYRDTETLIEGAEISAEILRMSLLAPTNGEMKLHIVGDGMTYNYDYDSDGTWKKDNYLELQDENTWDKETAKPLNDIQAAIAVLADKGVTARTVISNSATFNRLVGNPQIKGAILTNTGAAVTFVSTRAVQDVFRANFNVDWIVYDKAYLDYEGKQQKFYPDNYVTVIGDGAVGSTWRGTTPEELTSTGALDVPNANVDINVLGNGIAVAVMGEYKPSYTATTTVSQVVLPSFEGMDGVFVLKVIGD